MSIRRLHLWTFFFVAISFLSHSANSLASDNALILEQFNICLSSVAEDKEKVCPYCGNSELYLDHLKNVSANALQILNEFDGSGVVPSTNEANEFLKYATDLCSSINTSFVDGAIAAAKSFEQGEYVSLDITRSLAILEKATVMIEDARLMYSLGRLHYKNRRLPGFSVKRAFKLISKSVEMGYVQGNANLSYFYTNDSIREYLGFEFDDALYLALDSLHKAFMSGKMSGEDQISLAIRLRRISEIIHYGGRQDLTVIWPEIELAKGVNSVSDLINQCPDAAYDDSLLPYPDFCLTGNYVMRFTISATRGFGIYSTDEIRSKSSWAYNYAYKFASGASFIHRAQVAHKNNELDKAVAYFNRAASVGHYTNNERLEAYGLASMNYLLLSKSYSHEAMKSAHIMLPENKPHKIEQSELKLFVGCLKRHVRKVTDNLNVFDKHSPFPAVSVCERLINEYE